MSQVELLGQPLTLHRYPRDSDPSLQAWEAADEYLLNEIAPLLTTLTPGRLLILNDSFGALSCALQRYRPTAVSDSFLAQEACRRNLASNDLDADSVCQFDALAELPAAPELVLIKVPKTLALLEYQLHRLREVVTPATRIIAAGKARDIHTSTLKLFSQLLGETRTSLAWKKARLIYSQWQAPACAANPYPTCWPLEQTQYQIVNHANVFSRGSLDIGARFFLQHLPHNLSGRLADLGCGNGVLGLMALQHNPQAEPLFVDESHMAIASSRANVEQNRPQDLARCEFRLGNSLDGVEADSLRLVLCNPPFHQQQTITDQLAWQMFNDARRCLQPGGELLMIGNRHLGYHIKLQRLFSAVETVASNQKFVILRATKR